MHRIIVATLAATGLSVGISVAASAADLPRPAPAPVYTKAPVIAPLSWTGCYLGGNVGGGWNHSSFFDPTLGFSDGSANGSGIVGGGQIGCDYQLNSFVFGIQGMFDATSIKATGNQPFSAIANTDKIPWLATLTGRIGYTVTPSALIYAKGGGAWVRDEITGSLGGVTVASSNYNTTGWTAGAGIEYMFAPHWSVFGEYDYLGFGTKTSTFSGTPPIPPTFPINTTQNVQMGVVGVNYRFW